MGQLLTETVNEQLVNRMTYDGYGNIASKNGVVYTYGDSAWWKDRLTAYNGEAITYDAQGNPTNYCGRTMVWDKGRQLKSTWNKNQTVHVAYTYNANGIRTSKTINGMVYTYTLDGTKILREDRGSSDVLIPMYDNEDSICGLTLDGIPYYFQKNLQGDVIAITDANGDIVARYSYDAWGKCTVTLDTSGINISNRNPYRYRGYYYDSEIGMYYLQSRYYDPDVGRCICSDNPEFAAISSSVLVHNLYAYCCNDPVNEIDQNGQVFATILEKIFVGLILGFIKQFSLDVIEWAFAKFVLKKNVSLSVSRSEDYAATMLSSVADQFKPSCRMAMMLGVVNVLIKYIPKFIGGRMEGKDWINLLLDILVVCLLKLLDNMLRNLEGKVREIRRRRWGSKNSSAFRLPLKNIRAKIKFCGVVVNFAIPISQQFVSSYINIFCMKEV